MQAYRLSGGSCLERSKPLRFTFNGEALAGYAGDTLASALLANGRVLLGRSFKYHRPRGVLSHGSEEPNALVTLRAAGGRVDPNTRATMVELRDGLVAESQNHWPSLELRSRRGGQCARAHPAGRLLLQDLHVARFFLEEALRARHPRRRRPRAGAGAARSRSLSAPPCALRGADRRRRARGAGGRALRFGIRKARHRGRRERPLGWPLPPCGGAGSSFSTSTRSATSPFSSAPRSSASSVTTMPACFRKLARLRANASGRSVRARSSPRPARMSVRSSLPATTGPGILLADSARQYALKYGVAPGRQVVVATCGDSAYGAARDMLKAGVKVTTLVDLRPDPHVALVRRPAGPRRRRADRPDHRRH